MNLGNRIAGLVFRSNGPALAGLWKDRSREGGPGLPGRRLVQAAGAEFSGQG